MKNATQKPAARFIRFSTMRAYPENDGECMHYYADVVGEVKTELDRILLMSRLYEKRPELARADWDGVRNVVSWTEYA